MEWTRFRRTHLGPLPGPTVLGDPPGKPVVLSHQRHAHACVPTGAGSPRAGRVGPRHRHREGKGGFCLRDFIMLKRCPLKNRRISPGQCAQDCFKGRLVSQERSLGVGRAGKTWGEERGSNLGGKPSPTAEGGAAERPPWDRAAPGQAQAGPCAAAADAHQPGWLLLVTDHTLPLPPQLLGVAIRFGKFSVKENKQLEKNVQEFLSLSGIESADKLLYTDRYPEEKAVITDLKRKHAFRLHIGERAAAPLPAPTTVLPHGAPAVPVGRGAGPGRCVCLTPRGQASRRQPVLGVGRVLVPPSAGALPTSGRTRHQLQLSSSSA